MPSIRHVNESLIKHTTKEGIQHLLLQLPEDLRERERNPQHRGSHPLYCRQRRRLHLLPLQHILQYIPVTLERLIDPPRDVLRRRWFLLPLAPRAGGRRRQQSTAPLRDCAVARGQQLPPKMLVGRAVPHGHFHPLVLLPARERRCASPRGVRGGSITVDGGGTGTIVLGSGGGGECTGGVFAVVFPLPTHSIRDGVPGQSLQHEPRPLSLVMREQECFHRGGGLGGVSCRAFGRADGGLRSLPVRPLIRRRRRDADIFGFGLGSEAAAPRRGRSLLTFRLLN
mmetsp:Transcript_4326/g.12084  ORF Transcript_4326/g.12084 Transcript_4326/m.12084 type:complete len:283 (+) Transcript_4326:106-954(+)